MPHRRTGVVAALISTVVAVTVPAALAAGITGTDGDDVLTGTAEDDTIVGLAGNDLLLAGAGNDEVFGDEGDDRLVGDYGNDVLNGGGGADVLEGGIGGDYLRLRGSDRAYGGPQRDRVVWTYGAVEVHGGDGPDLIDGGGRGFQQVYGEGGPDRIQLVGPMSTRSVLSGGGGRDQVGVGVDGSGVAIALVLGGPGDDGVYGGARRLRGGTGDDILTMNVAGHVHCGPGTDVVTTYEPEAVISDDCEDVSAVLFVRDGVPLTGTRYDDYVYDGAGDDTITTLSGADEVQDLAGSDTVDLGPGDDTFTTNGEQGDDEVDTITCGDGYDTVYPAADDVVAADCEVVDPR